mgnify:FL=1
MGKIIFLFLLLCFCQLSGQQDNVSIVRDGFLTIGTDARAAAQGDIGVATATDAFSQFWNPSKYIFSEKKSEIGITQIFTNSNDSSGYSQLNLIFYNKLDDRSAYAISTRNYSLSFDDFTGFGTSYNTNELAIDGSYSLRLSEVFAMSVGGRFISLNNKVALVEGSGFGASSSLYGIDVSGFYYGSEIGYKKFIGRWRAGFNFSNLRGKSSDDIEAAEIYAPSILKVGVGFDFIFDQDNQLGITSEYKMLLDSYTENDSGEELNFGIKGSVMALGLEFTYLEKATLRTGYSQGINRPTDTFASLGMGLQSRYVDLDIAFLFGLSYQENPIRNKLRLSLGLDLDEVFSNGKNQF